MPRVSLLYCFTLESLQVCAHEVTDCSVCLFFILAGESKFYCITLPIIALIIKNLIYHDPTPGWPSMVCIILLVSGVQLFCLGIVGQYLSKTYLEVKKRPIYLVKEEL